MLTLAWGRKAEGQDLGAEHLGAHCRSGWAWVGSLQSGYGLSWIWERNWVLQVEERGGKPRG